MSLARKRPENLGRPADRLVPRLMPQGIVDLLEIVQIHNEQGAGILRGHLFQPLLDAVLHRSPVQQPGEGVLGGPLLQFFKPMLQIGSIHRYPIRLFHTKLPQTASKSGGSLPNARRNGDTPQIHSLDNIIPYL